MRRAQVAHRQAGETFRDEGIPLQNNHHHDKDRQKRLKSERMILTSAFAVLIVIPLWFLWLQMNHHRPSKALGHHYHGHVHHRRGHNNNNIQSYHSPHHLPKSSDIHPFSVLLWNQAIRQKRTTAAENHILLNGVEESPFLQLFATNITSDGKNEMQQQRNTTYPANLVIVAFYSEGRFCDRLDATIQQYQQQHAHSDYSSLSVRIVTYSDETPSGWKCSNVEDSMKQSIRSSARSNQAINPIPPLVYFRRSIVEDRRWDKDLQWVRRGHVVAEVDPEAHTVPINHCPFTVRTDTVQALQELLQQSGHTLSDSIESLDRPVDVSHFWPLPNDPSAVNVTFQLSKLRSRVSALLNDIGKLNHPDWSMFIGLHGEGRKTGRNQVHHTYVQGLLESKIVVVTQRDNWEDMWRTFEAMASGAMVISDLMVAPPRGLVNGTSIIFCSDASQLEPLIAYYLAHEDERLSIARQGRLVAMSQHRSWHRMEQIIFGELRSKCPHHHYQEPQPHHHIPMSKNNRTEDDPCPLTVHAVLQ